MIRWVSFGTGAMPRLPPLADHEDPVEFDDGLASFVEPARPDPDESEAGTAAGFADLRDSGLGVQRVPVEDRTGEADGLHADLEPVRGRPGGRPLLPSGLPRGHVVLRGRPDGRSG